MLKNKSLKPDPRTVIIANISVSLAAVLIRNAAILAGIFVCTAGLVFLLGENPLRVMRKLKRLIAVIFATALLQSLFIRSGEVLISVGSFPLLTSGGIISGLLVLLRMAVLIMGGAAIASCGVRNGIQALIQMRIPYEIAFMVYIAIHFIPLLSQEMRDAVTAIQLRGVDIGNIPMRKRIQVYTYLFMPVVGASIVRAQDLSANMELRGFRAYKTRTSLRLLRMSALDYFFILFFVSGTAVALFYYYLII